MKRLPILIILIAYLIIGALYAIYTPPWQAPDEPAHYNYIRQLAMGQWPVIEQGDYDQSYINEVVFNAHFDPAYDLDSISYEDWQPPLYYLLLTPVYWLFDGALIPLRLFSMLFGAGIILFAFAIAQRIFPKRPYLAYTTAVFVAFLPQHIAIMAALNNDSLAELIIAGTLWQLLRLQHLEHRHSERSEESLKPNSTSTLKASRNRHSERSEESLVHPTSTQQFQNYNIAKQAQHSSKTIDRAWLLLSIWLGFGLLTKATVYLLVPLIGLIILRLFWGNWSRLWRVGWLVFGPAFLMGCLWWGRNLIVYGGLDIMAVTAHDTVVVGQPRTADWIADNGLAATFTRFRQFTFNSFWGQFGWMTVLLPTIVYRLLGLLSLAFLSGLFLNRWQKRDTADKIPPLATFTFLLLFLLTLALYGGYNLTYVQHQGRYLFPALIPIAIAITLGVGGWATLLLKRWPQLYNILPIGLGGGMYTLALWALFRVIVPNL